jgi:hypothetical protein
MTWPFAFAFATLFFVMPVTASPRLRPSEVVTLIAQWLAIVVCFGVGIGDLLGAAPIGGCR